jgi:tetratricopeptide (TPR) repeat protein
MAKQNVQKEEVLIDVAETTHKVEDFFTKFRKPLYIGLAAIVAAIGGYFYLQSSKESSQKKALAAMWQAERQFEQDSLAKAIGGDGTMQGFQNIISKYGNAPIANAAQLYSGISYLNLGKFDEAIKALEDFSASGEVAPTMKYGVLGDAYSEKKDFSSALKNYKKASEMGSLDDLKAYYLKKYAMLSEIQGDAAAALSAYEDIKKNFGTSAEARDIDKYIARAAAKKK